MTFEEIVQRVRVYLFELRMSPLMCKVSLPQLPLKSALRRLLAMTAWHKLVASKQSTTIRKRQTPR